jgi:hypothetical protein
MTTFILAVALGVFLALAAHTLTKRFNDEILGLVIIVMALYLFGSMIYQYLTF